MKYVDASSLLIMCIITVRICRRKHFFSLPIYRPTDNNQIFRLKSTSINEVRDCDTLSLPLSRRLRVLGTIAKRIAYCPWPRVRDKNGFLNDNENVHDNIRPSASNEKVFLYYSFSSRP